MDAVRVSAADQSGWKIVEMNGEKIGYVRRARSGPFWWAMDTRNRNVARYCYTQRDAVERLMAEAI